jgi:putative transposase
MGLSVVRGCQLLGITRQAWYQQCARERQREVHAQMLIDAVQRERALQPCVGTRKLQRLLQQSGLVVGRDRLFALLREHRLLVPTKRAYHKTTHSHHRFRKHPNLLKPGEHQVIPQRPEQVWVADITYLPVYQGEAYLSLVTDAYSRKIVGHCVHDNLKAELVIGAYQQALKQRHCTEGLIHHSDRGIQYCSAQYQALHHQHGVHCSMTDGYDCYQNALAERVNGILKNEFLVRKPRDIAEAKVMVAESIRIYNERRPHLSLGYKTPDEVHRAFG